MNTADYLLADHPDQNIALWNGGQSHTYGDLRRAARTIAARLIDLGIQPGDRLAVVDTNSLFWVAAYLAGLKLGAKVTPIAPTLPADQIRGILQFIEPIATCAGGAYSLRIQDALLGTILTEAVLRQESRMDWPDTFWDGNPDSDAALMFTSGTTSQPRLVRVTHRNIQANTDSIIEYLNLSNQDSILAVLQFYYCFGTSLLHSHLRCGGSLVLARSFLYPELVLDLLETRKCSGFAGVPANYQTLLRNSTFLKRSLPALRKIQQAGGKLQTPLIQELVSGFPQAEVFIMYGQTEATARLSCLPPRFLSTKIGSIGMGIPGVRLDLVNEAGHPPAPNEVGEIVARGDNISPGYWQNEQASKAKFKHGALYTGDMARRDEDGFLYIVDRSADFIKTSGYRVSSQAVEECILELPDVASAAVVGAPDDLRGEIICAFLVMRKDAAWDPDAVQRHCRERLNAYMVPRRIIRVDALPVNIHGKVQKNELRHLAASQD